MPSVELRESVPVAAAPETVWAVATDWPRQREWMLGTEVRVLSGGGGLGTQLLAFTGLGGVGFVDTMEITELQPPRSVRVRHTGQLVSGEGGFDIVRVGNAAALFVWWERFRLPRGGTAVWPAVRPALSWGLRRSLRAFAELCRREEGRG